MLTQKRLKELLKYDPDTGLFTWLVNRSRKARFGLIAGYTDKQGYSKIIISGVSYKAHRLAWIYIYGSFPENGIDHINKNKSDNRIENLRDCDQSENMRNQKLYKSNKSGVPGVMLRESSNRWLASISYNKKLIRLGNHIDWFDAVCARKSAENKHGFHINHGRTA
jgi:hypothetical protein